MLRTLLVLIHAGAGVGGLIVGLPAYPIWAVTLASGRDSVRHQGLATAAARSHLAGDTGPSQGEEGVLSRSPG